ncbi:sulfurtransferase TusA family protein [Marivibrio halodurans]|uniref:Sulfurtransferase TusA family protein n=1 Tax=Marivibrio halodurans TaxID=2039722 RepID=A0A8J7RZJ2_9PROT|nr:sulfurtransferase TusA family protein [Marivibrio halodurans]MBP5857185.1 sulfurtransferase TusA family protein [Marivibrio halodurans]
MARDHRLDATGLKCPLPVLKARKLLKDLAPGDTLDVTATDPGAPKDFEAFCESQGCDLLESAEEGGVYRIRLRKL